MATPRSTRNPLFHGRWFDDQIIVLCVRWYVSYKLSYRDLVEMMADRGLSVSHTTVMRWRCGSARVRAEVASIREARGRLLAG